MKKVYVLFYFLFSVLLINAQTVFTDAFTTSTGTTYTNAAGAIGTSTNWSLTRSGADWGARIDGGMMPVLPVTLQVGFLDIRQQHPLRRRIIQL